MTEMTGPLHCAIDNGLAILTLSNPDGGNVLDMPMIKAFTTAVVALDPATVRAVLINARGKNFCVGGDIRAFAAVEDRGALLTEMAGGLHVGLKALDALGVPVVTAINGAAAGAGLGLAVCGDYAVCGESSSFTMAYTGIGLAPDGGASWFLPRLIGLRRTQDMAYMNRRVMAAEALDWGLVSKVVADEALQEEALTVARRLASGPTVAFRAIKGLLDRSTDTTLADQLDAETAAIARAGASQDGGEGVAAFLEKRKPVYTGS